MHQRPIVLHQIAGLRIAQLARPSNDQFKYRLGIIGRGGDRLQHLDAGRLPREQGAVFRFAFLFLGYIGRSGRQTGDPAGRITLGVIVI